MNIWGRCKTHCFALLSIACPIVTIAVVLSVQTISHADFWKDVLANTGDDANRGAGALMAISEFIVLIFSTMLACLIGLLLFVISIFDQKKLTWVSLLALAINALPLLLFLAQTWMQAG